MDTLPSSVSSLQVPKYTLVHRKSSDFSRFKPPLTTTTSHPNLTSVNNNPNSFVSSNKPPSFSQKTTSKLAKNYSPSLELPQSSSSSSSSPSKQVPLVHRNAATGYAAALIDVAQCSNRLRSMEKDVKRFLKLLSNNELQGFMMDPHVKQSEKGQVVKELAEKGKFHKHLVGLIKMLVDKTKLGMVTQVLMEFQRIFEELSGTNRFLVPS
ncbi:Atp synthase delta chain, chloroplastic [Heracleum sosnowskyi]|uniref:Atp synthase delta chain, chloroplastic n=1 Tax=Heracleum sosnowskyi TaxID=360622 RepID=A0AAD8HPC1_9APIA|nr:Atp synthase delta chain, chloroplastic [Heracleum sosnowskyi]